MDPATSDDIGPSAPAIVHCPHRTCDLRRWVQVSPIVAYGGFWLLVDEAHIATVASHPGLAGLRAGPMADVGAA